MEKWFIILCVVLFLVSITAGWFLGVRRYNSSTKKNETENKKENINDKKENDGDE